MSIQIRRILVAVDFSETSDHAFDYAVSLARAFEAEVLAFHNLEDPVLYAAVTDDSFRDAYERVIQGKLNKLTQRHGCEGVKAATAMRAGSAFLEIIRQAREWKADLIVMGTHGHGPVKHLLLGSVAEKVVRKAGCSVLTVRPGQHDFVMP